MVKGTCIIEPMSPEEIFVTKQRIKYGKNASDVSEEILKVQNKESVVAEIQRVKENSMEDPESGRRRFLGHKPHKSPSDQYRETSARLQGKISSEIESETPGAILRKDAGSMMGNAVSGAAFYYEQVLRGQMSESEYYKQVKEIVEEEMKEWKFEASLKGSLEYIILTVATTAQGIWDFAIRQNNDIILQREIAKEGSTVDVSALTSGTLPHLETELLVLDADQDEGGYSDITFILENGHNITIDIKTKLAKDYQASKIITDPTYSVGMFSPSMGFDYENQLEVYARGMLGMYKSKTAKSLIMPVMLSLEFNEDTGEYSRNAYTAWSFFTLDKLIKEELSVREKTLLKSDQDKAIIDESINQLRQKYEDVKRENITHRLNLMNSPISKTGNYNLDDTIHRLYEFVNDFYSRTRKIFTSDDYQKLPYLKQRIAGYKTMIDKLINYADISMLRTQLESLLRDYQRITREMNGMSDRINSLTEQEKIEISRDMRILQAEAEIIADFIMHMKDHARDLELNQQTIDQMVADGLIKKGEIPFTKKLAGFTEALEGRIPNFIKEALVNNGAVKIDSRDVRDFTLFSVIDDIIIDLKKMRRNFDMYAFKDTLEIDDNGVIIAPDIGMIRAWTDNLLYINHPLFTTLRKQILDDRWAIKDKTEAELRNFYEKIDAFYTAMNRAFGYNKSKALDAILDYEHGLLIADVSPEFDEKRNRLFKNYKQSEDDKTKAELVTFMRKYYVPSEIYKADIHRRRLRHLETITSRYYELIPKEDLTQEQIQNDPTIIFDDELDSYKRLHQHHYLNDKFYDAVRALLTRIRTSQDEKVINESRQLLESLMDNDYKKGLVLSDTRIREEMVSWLNNNDLTPGMYIHKDPRTDSWNDKMVWPETIYKEQDPDSAWTNEGNIRHMQVAPEARQDFMSEEWSKIKDIPEAVELLDYLYNLNDVAKILTGRKLPRNLVPNFKKELIESIEEQVRGVSVERLDKILGRLIMSDMRIDSEDAIMDLSFNKDRKLDLHVMGTNWLVDADGDHYAGETERDIKIVKTNASLKSMQLESIIPLFLQSIQSYAVLSKSEAYAQTLLDLVNNPDQLKIEARNRDNKALMNKQINSIFKHDILGGNNTTNLVRSLTTLVNWHWYHVRYAPHLMVDNWMNFQSKKGLFAADPNTGLGPVNSKKVILFLQKVYSAKILGFGVIPGAGALLAGTIAAIINSFEHEFMSVKSLKQAQATITKAFASRDRKTINRITSLTMAMETVNQASINRRRFRRIKKVEKVFSPFGLFAPYHFADNILGSTNTIAVAMFHTIIDGKMVKLDKAPEGSKSIWDMWQYDQDPFVNPVEPTEEIKKWRTQFQTIVKTVNQETYGQLSEGDLMMYQTTLLGTMLGMFKSWLPQLFYKRFRKTEYFTDLQAIREGRYITWAKQHWPQGKKEELIAKQLEEFERINEDDGINIMKGTMIFMAESIQSLLFNIDLLWNTNKTPSKLNKTRMKLNFLKWRADNPLQAKQMGDTTDIQFAQWQEMVERNIRSGLAELYAILTLYVGLYALKADYDDDEKSDLTENYWFRQIYKVVNKARTEVLFFLNPMEGVRMISSPFPMVALLKDVHNTIWNGIDEIRDLTLEQVFGQPVDKRDKTPFLYYGSRWIPGVYQLRKLAEIFEQDKRSYYEL